MDKDDLSNLVEERTLQLRWYQGPGTALPRLQQLWLITGGYPPSNDIRYEWRDVPTEHTP
jgi:hypothetical protein